MIDIKVKDGLYIITAPKTTLVLTREQFIAALKRGKAWLRAEAMAARASQP